MRDLRYIYEKNQAANKSPLFFVCLILIDCRRRKRRVIRAATAVRTSVSAKPVLTRVIIVATRVDRLTVRGVRTVRSIHTVRTRQNRSARKEKYVMRIVATATVAITAVKASVLTAATRPLTIVLTAATVIAYADIAVTISAQELKPRIPEITPAAVATSARALTTAVYAA